MSNLAPTEHCQALYNEMGQATGAQGDTMLPGALPFLLQPDPEAIIEVELVDRPLDLPEEQFEALLIDSECEV